MAAAADVPIAFQNRGGIRADLPAGALTFGQVFEVLPFDNHIAVVTVSGRTLERALALLHQRRQKTPFCAGVSVTTIGDHVQVRLASGAPLVADARYRVATNDYLAYGGEGIDLTSATGEGFAILDATVLDALVAELRRRYPPAH
jgi:5'-nucleotidase